MSGVNKVIIVGRLGADPEARQTTNGQNVTRFNVATSEQWKDKNSGQMQERTEWHRVVVWGRLGEICAQHLSKGRQAYIEGRLQTRSWEDQNGQKKYSTEVIAQNVQFLGGRDSTSSDAGSPSYNNASGGGDQFGQEPAFDADEEIPF